MIRVFPQNYVVWDLETSGLDPKGCHIVEAAVIVVRDGNIVEEWSSLLNNEIDINPKATEVHGITREMCANEGVEPQKALLKLLRYINDAEAHVTHNGSRFDIPFLVSSLERAGTSVMNEVVERSHIDTAALYKAHKLQMRKPWGEEWGAFFKEVLDQRVYGLKYNVKACCDELGISLEGVEQHRALADVLLTNQIYQKLIS